MYIIAAQQRLRHVATLQQVAFFEATHGLQGTAVLRGDSLGTLGVELT
jgi:hypothetical protein